jgi:hypothetical protein
MTSPERPVTPPANGEGWCMSRPGLDALGTMHQTDKASGHHDYLTTYERYLSGFRDDPITVLELGVLEGASLRMWRDYFPNAKIIGCDRHQVRRKYAGERIAIEVGDCGDPDFLARVAGAHGPFTLVVDDASHFWRHQQIAFTALFDHVLPGGVFIIEDIHTSYLPRYEGGLGGERTVDWLRRALDHVVPMPQEYADLGLAQGSHHERQWRHDVHELVFIREACLVTKRRAPRP